MKFIVSSVALLKHISLINGVISSKPVVPILENFLFDIFENKLTITASNMQVSIVTTLPINVEGEGRIAIPSRILLETLRNLPECSITFTLDVKTYTVQINSDNGQYKLSGENPNDFPRIPEIVKKDSISIPSGVLTTAINNTIFATSNDEIRISMMGVFFSIDNSHITFVATDGHKLVKYKRDDISSETYNQMIIPQKALSLLKTLLPSENVAVDIDFNGVNASFSFNETKLTCKLIDERYPEYQNVIPTDNNITMRVDRTELLGGLRRVVFYANQTSFQIKFSITGNELMISAEDLDYSNAANERLSCDHIGKDIDIGFNAKLLTDLVKNMDSEEVEFSLSTPHNGVILRPVDKNENEALLMLAMPITIQNK